MFAPTFTIECGDLGFDATHDLRDFIELFVDKAADSDLLFDGRSRDWEQAHFCRTGARHICRSLASGLEVIA